MNQGAPPPLQGVHVVITRPAGSGRTLARRVRALGGIPQLLPGLSLRAMPREPAHGELCEALKREVLIFTSPAAVRFARDLRPLHTRALVLAVGQGTARALHRAGLDHARAPEGERQHSEGLLADPALQDIGGRRVSLVTAPGGRGKLTATLKDRGAEVHEVHVYRRVPPRLDRRHHQMLARLPAASYALVTSHQALDCLLQALPQTSCTQLLACYAVVSSARLQARARDAGFQATLRATSARADDLLQAVVADHERTCGPGYGCHAPLGLA